MTQPEPANEPLPEEEGSAPEAEEAAEVFPPPPPPPPQPSGGQELAQAKAKIAELEKKLVEVKDQALRALAEADNTRKRAERAREDTAKFAVQSFARDLMSVADNLRRALGAMPKDALERNPELTNIHTGVAAIERDLHRIFDNNGIKRVDPLNQKFDANLHEVMFEVEATGQPAGTVVQVIDPGYTIHERLLRPARVGVAKGDSGPASPPPGEEIDQLI
ncbi:MAG: nucleotide exchange factor GrpE [Alphaproteobacteria bacterium]|nr:MAG: nucleotide exchange factor GrpE [Alphaproteobacteria bacterium]